MKLKGLLCTLAATAAVLAFGSLTAGAQNYIKGDVDGNGQLNLIDVSMLTAYIGGDAQLRSEGAWAADINGDGIVDYTDVATAVGFINGDISLDLPAYSVMTVGTMAAPTGEDIAARAIRLSETAFWGVPRYNFGNARPDAYNFTYGNAAVEEVIAYNGIDCSQVVNYALGTLGLSTGGLNGSGSAQYHYVPPSTHGWTTSYWDDFSGPIGTDLWWITDTGTWKQMKVLKNGEYTWQRPYWEMYDGSTIPVGTVVLGIAVDGYGNRTPVADHMWVYLGEYDNSYQVKEYIARLTGKSVDDVRTPIGTMGYTYGVGGISNTCTHWRLESTSTYHGFGTNSYYSYYNNGWGFSGVQINNDYCNGPKDSGAFNYKIYAFAPPEY